MEGGRQLIEDDRAHKLYASQLGAEWSVVRCIASTTANVVSLRP